MTNADLNLRSHSKEDGNKGGSTMKKLLRGAKDIEVEVIQ